MLDLQQRKDNEKMISIGEAIGASASDALWKVTSDSLMDMDLQNGTIVHPHYQYVPYLPMSAKGRRG